MFSEYQLTKKKKRFEKTHKYLWYFYFSMDINERTI